MTRGVAPRKTDIAVCFGRWGEGLFLTVALFALTLGPVYTARVRLAPLAGDFTADLTTQSFFVVIYLAAAFFLARRQLDWGGHGFVLVALAFFCLVLVSSSVWSVAPTESFPLALLTAATAILGLYGGRGWSARALARALYSSSVAGLVWSLWAIRRHWPLATDANGDWAGIYFNRNSLGPVASMAILAGGFVLIDLVGDRRKDIRRRWPCTIVAAFGLSGTMIVSAWVLTHNGSFTAPMACVAAAAASLLVSGVRRKASPDAAGRRTIVAVAVVSLAVAAYTDRYRNDLVGPISKQRTLSGRTYIWHLVRQWIEVRPKKGWGWMGPWTFPPTRSAMDSTGYHVFSAHSGYLEVALGAGWLGVTALVVLVGTMAIVVLNRAARGTDHSSLLAVALLVYGLVVNLTETFIGANLLPWALLVAASVLSVDGPAVATAGENSVASSPIMGG